MSFLLPGAPPALPPDAFEYALIRNSASSNSLSSTFTASNGNKATIVVTSIEMTATLVEPSQWYAEAWLNSVGYPFFHDSQSTGEGLGISFYWRGRLIIDNGDSLHLKLQNISGLTPVDLAHYADGYWRPVFTGLP